MATDSLREYLVETRRALHQIPELAFMEEETAGLICRELSRMDIPYDYAGVGGGIVARITCADKDAPVIALRAEMDALPGEENTGLAFSSRHTGRVHACGHDAHMAMLLGGARLIRENPVAVNVLLVFQPAEENGGGARKILETGLLDNVAAIFAGHVTHHYPLGEIMIGHGIITAQSDRFEVKITGKGGHGARPHEATDAVIIAASLINTIQTLISREVDPLHPSVVTVGQMEAGTAPNMIAETATLRGSIRTTQRETRDRIFRGLARMTAAFEALHGAQIALTITEGYPPVVNTKKEVDLCHQAAINAVSEEGVVMMEYPSMGSEDFAYYLQKMPGAYVRIGARREEQPFLPLHSPSFDINEDVLPIGARYFEQVARIAADYYDASSDSL